MEQMGQSFAWWFGVVEDRDDPLKVGRVRVRCFSYHTPDRKKLPTEDLPWAQVIQDVTSAAMGDVGRSPTGLVEGSWVFGFFLDGQEAQRPMVLGSLAAVPSEFPDFVKGFSDPNGNYPYRIGEPDVNRLARNDSEYEHPIEFALSGEALTGVGVALSGQTWDQPVYSCSATYPLNHVFESESGHVQEIDDTPGSERRLDMHRTGTYEYVDADGKRVVRVRNSNYEIVSEDDHLFVSGDCSITVNGNYNLRVLGDMNLQVDGSMNFNVASNVDGRVGGTSKLSLSGALHLIVGGIQYVRALARNLLVTGDNLETVRGNHSVRYESDYSEYYGADKYERHDAGINYSCPLDPTRTSGIDCSDVDTSSEASSPQSFTLASDEQEVVDGTLIYRDPYHPKNVKPVLDAVFSDSTPSIREISTVTVIDQEDDPVQANTIVNCSDFSDSLNQSDYSRQISNHYTLGNLSIGAVFPHRIVAQNGLEEGQIACNLKALATNVLDPIRDHFGGSFNVNSGFRQRRNGRSDHEYGQAVDIQFPGYSRAQTLEAAKWIRDNIPAYKQVIFENMGSGGGWIHVSYANSRGANSKDVLTTSNGRSYSTGLFV